MPCCRTLTLALARLSCSSGCRAWKADQQLRSRFHCGSLKWHRSALYCSRFSDCYVISAALCYSHHRCVRRALLGYGGSDRMTAGKRRMSTERHNQLQEHNTQPVISSQSQAGYLEWRWLLDDREAVILPVETPASNSAQKFASAALFHRHP